MILTKDIFVNAGGAIDTSLHRKKHLELCLKDAPKHWIKHRKMMSSPAWINALLTHKVFEQLPWELERSSIGHYMGVGASGAELEELNNIIKDCLEETTPSTTSRFSYSRYGRDGLAACNPLFAFQLMNNFTMCHSSILEQLGGPNSVFYSRGLGSYMALREACLSIDQEQTTKALVGASDSANHPVTKAELLQQGQLDPEVTLEDGAAVIALSVTRSPYLDLISLNKTDFLIRVRSVSTFGGNYQNRLSELLHEFISSHKINLSQTLFCTHSSQPSNSDSLHEQIEISLRTTTENLNSIQGESLAATPTIAWINGIDQWLQSDQPFLTIFTHGLDQGLGVLQLERTQE